MVEIKYTFDISTDPNDDEKIILTKKVFKDKKILTQKLSWSSLDEFKDFVVRLADTLNRFGHKVSVEWKE